MAISGLIPALWLRIAESVLRVTPNASACLSHLGRGTPESWLTKELIALDEALEHLRKISERQVSVVESRIKHPLRARACLVPVIGATIILK